MHKITPFLWFDNQAEEAVNFYTSVFTNSEILDISRYGEAGPGPQGAVMTVSFRLEEQRFVALNGGPLFHFTPAISFMVECRRQEEVDRLWERLSAGGEPGQCGWLTDKFGISWQIVPTLLMELLMSDDPERTKRVMQAMFTMTKFDLAALQAAHDGEEAEPGQSDPPGTGEGGHYGGTNNYHISDPGWRHPGTRRSGRG